MNNLALKIDEDIPLEILADEKFDLKQSIIVSREILDNLVDDDSYEYRLKLEFDEDIWILPYNGGTLSFDFNKLHHLLNKINNQNSLENILRVKCWIASILRSVSSNRAATLYKRLLDAIEKTNFFKVDKADDFAEYIRDAHFTDIYKLSFIQVTLNFLDFNLQYELYEIYDGTFYELSNSLNIKKNVRTLPAVKDVITFSEWLDHFYKTEMEKEETSSLLMRFYPVVIWWKLSSIIPLRPSEFCEIKRDSFGTDENPYLLKIPRKKNKKNVQVINEITISEELGNIINDYLEKTKKFGKTKTLISYRAINSTYTQTFKDQTTITKFDFDVFNYSNLISLVNSFHDEVLSKKFNLKIVPKKQNSETEADTLYDISKRILPGDPRHLAIMSLINQKYHPVEVARLAGHSTLNSYYHYSNHKSYWVDLEVQKLMYKFQQEKSAKTQGKIQFQQSIWSEITTRALLKPATSSYYEKKEIGYCTDALKRCFTECVFCKHWRISREEFEKNLEYIEEKISQKESEATGLLTDIFNLMQAFNVDEFSAINPDIKNILDAKLMMLDAKIQDISKLKLIEEVNLSNE